MQNRVRLANWKFMTLYQPCMVRMYERRAHILKSVLYSGNVRENKLLNVDLKKIDHVSQVLKFRVCMEKLVEQNY